MDFVDSNIAIFTYSLFSSKCFKTFSHSVSGKINHLKNKNTRCAHQSLGFESFLSYLESSSLESELESGILQVESEYQSYKTGTHSGVRSVKGKRCWSRGFVSVRNIRADYSLLMT